MHTEDDSGRQVARLGKSDKLNEHFKNAVVAALAAIPVVGGPLSILIDKYMPEQRQHRVLRALEMFEARLQKLEKSTSTEYILTDEFLTIFEQSLRGISETHREDMYDLYVEFLSKTLIDPKLATYEEKELYLQMIRNLTVGHIAVLSAFPRFGQFCTRLQDKLCSPSIYEDLLQPGTMFSSDSGDSNPRSVEYSRYVTRTIEAQVGEQTTGILESHITLLLHDLTSQGLLEYQVYRCLLEGDEDWSDKSHEAGSIPITLTRQHPGSGPTQIRARLNPRGYILTPLCVQFLEYVTNKDGR